MRLAWACALALAIVGCTAETSIALRTAGSDEPCLLALLQGAVLVPDKVSGLGLLARGGMLLHPYWPSGWTARQNGSSTALLDANGGVVAHVGDTLSMGGGLGNDGVYYVCPTSPVQIVSTPSPSDNR